MFEFAADKDIWGGSQSYRRKGGRAQVSEEINWLNVLLIMVKICKLKLEFGIWNNKQNVVAKLISITFAILQLLWYCLSIIEIFKMGNLCVWHDIILEYILSHWLKK